MKIDIELQNPNDMKTSMSMARAYERHANIVADLSMLTSTRATTRMAPQPQLAPKPTPAIAPTPSTLTTTIAAPVNGTTSLAGQ